MCVKKGAPIGTLPCRRVLKDERTYTVLPCVRSLYAMMRYRDLKLAALSQRVSVCISDRFSHHARNELLPEVRF